MTEQRKLTAIGSQEIQSFVQQWFKNQLKTDKFSVVIENGSKKGDNFIGTVYRAVATKFNGTTEEEWSDEGEKQYSIIVKVASQKYARRQYFHLRSCFLQEIYMYDKVLSAFHLFQSAKDITMQGNYFYEYPACFSTIDSNLSEALLLEDLRERGFEVMDLRHEPVSFEHIKLVMQALGKFHAISFALKEQASDHYNILASKIREMLFIKSDKHRMEYLNSLREISLNSLKSKGDAELARKMQEIGSNTDILEQCLSSGDAEPHTVICHGDCWNNNTLFRHNSNNKPIEMCLLDWQYSRISSPAIDISSYIFTCTTKSTRDLHYEEFLRIYHNSLTNMLKRLGADTNVYPFKTLLDHLRKFGKFGLIMAELFLPVITSTLDVFPDLDAVTEDVQSGSKRDVNGFITLESQDIFFERLRHIIIDMNELGYI